MSVLEGLEFYISKKVGRAIMDYQMLSDQDKLAVAVSGGPDSLVLLRILLARKKFVPIKYELLALHLDLGYPRSFSRSIENYFKKLGVKYHIAKARDLEAIYPLAESLGCNKIALGHHKDDIVESILSNLFFKGEIFSLSPARKLSKAMIIRPLAYVEESMIRKLVQKEKLPGFTCKCPRSTDLTRSKIKKIIIDFEKTCPEIKTNIFKSLLRIKQDYLL